MNTTSLALIALMTTASSPGTDGKRAPPAAEQDAGEQEPLSLDEMQSFIFDKLSYDEQYFSKVLRAHESGRPLPGMSRATFRKEVSRAKKNLPVLARFLSEKGAFDKGKPLSLPPKSAAFREYRNLLTLLNMFQAQREGRPRDLVRYGDSIVVRKAEDLGKVRGAKAEYYVSMYRAYFYLMGSGHYALKHDAKAIEWFARLEADKDLAGLKEQITKEEPDEAKEEELRVEALRTRPVAVMPFGNNTGDADKGWISSALLEVLTVDLLQSSDLVVVERGQVDKLAEEAALALGGFTEQGKAAEVGGMLGAGTLLVGAYQKEGDKLLLTLRLVETETERVVAAASGAGAEAEVFQVARKLLLDVLGSVGWNDAVLAEELLARHAPSAGTARQLHEARLLMSTKQDQAKALYAKAIKEDPALANLYGDLRKQFQDLAATVAVLPFVNVSGRDDDAWMVRAALESLSTDLPRLGFNAVERGQVEALMEERLLGEGAFLDAGEASELGRALGADFMVLGSVLHQRPTLRLDLRFVEVETGLIVFATSAENQRDDLPAALVSLATQIAERFNQPLDDETIDGLLASRMSPEELERLAREQLAKESLARSRTKTRPGEQPPGEDGLDLSQLALWGSIGSMAAGAGVAATGFALAAGPGDRANQLHGVQFTVTDAATRDQLRAQRDAAALEANAWTGVGYAGVGLAALGVTYLAASGVMAALAPTEEGRPDGDAKVAEAR